MKCAILIIGSLHWDDDNGRKEWREDRLDMSSQVRVGAPIFYGRKSRTRNDTYTMCLAPERPLGSAVCAPCRQAIACFADLGAEASALWKAEAQNSKGSVGSSWGNVAVMFREKQLEDRFGVEWDAFFKQNCAQQSTNPLAGRLQISWPRTKDDDEAPFDIILATVTRSEQPAPAPDVVALAWCEQTSGQERYFTENVRNGIRTPDDHAIWARIVREQPHWMSSQDSLRLFEIFRSEIDEAQ